MMNKQLVILITVIALILDRCDSSTSLDAVDSLTIAVRFEHSKPLENLEYLHSFVRKTLMGSRERGIERVSMIEFGGGANSSPSGMVVRDLGDDDVEIEKNEKLVAEFGRKLAAIKNVRAERLTDIARRSRRENDSSAIVMVVSMTAATDPKSDVVEQKRREMRPMATRAVRNGADIAVLLNSYQKSANSQLNAVYFWNLKNSSVAMGEWNESSAATTADSIGAKILDVIDELMRGRGKTRRRRSSKCVEDGCYYKAADVSVLPVIIGFTVVGSIILVVVVCACFKKAKSEHGQNLVIDAPPSADPNPPEPPPIAAPPDANSISIIVPTPSELENSPPTSIPPAKTPGKTTTTKKLDRSANDGTESQSQKTGNEVSNNIFTGKTSATATVAIGKETSVAASVLTTKKVKSVQKVIVEKPKRNIIVDKKKPIVVVDKKKPKGGGMAKK